MARTTRIPESDHPRSRGVYYVYAFESTTGLGSSPLARGLRYDGHHRTSGVGIIPARAGFTARGVILVTRRRDHPRSRGVYVFPRPRAPITMGSSPLARGLLTTAKGSIAEGRIIPARAGFTSRPSIRRTNRTDHPRSRGVYMPQCRSCTARLGSSPLARGLRAADLRELRVERIIPARAGFTCRDPIVHESRPDHPRSRGVYIWSMLNFTVRSGSSPLARGLHSESAESRNKKRIIPARAGFTSVRKYDEEFRRDHPRSRGVYGPVRTPVGAGAGSSPLARGLPTWWRIRCRGLRIIPARAGFTARQGGRVHV